ncbi:riboflavin synthase [soil metagenome]
MFTGLVETTGTVSALEGGDWVRLSVGSPGVASGVEVGDSVSVNGVCLTVEKGKGGEVSFHVMPETLRRTALGDLAEGDPVNLERAMGLESRFGGHIVQGHVDGVGKVLDIRKESGAEVWAFGAPEDVLRYTVRKGSICIDGISLTVVSVGRNSLTVSILPQTRAGTNLGALKVGDRVNLEADIIGKYVNRLLEPRANHIVNNFERSVEDAV